MNLANAIRLLRVELKRVEATIAALEELGKPDPSVRSRSRRGRKGMGPDERQQVAERMRRYWAARRGQHVG